ncbi:MAG: VOC family protein [Chloroflexi bacterium]|nr:VOC family protein [Chloroflexota bacterium]MDA1173140.1 VOC family protein [Chloroflexota bacterium]
MTGTPFPSPDMEMTLLLVVDDVERSKAWYVDVLGATVHREYGVSSCVLRFLDNWLLLVTGGGPSDDKPTVSMTPPVDADRVSAEVTIREPDCQGAYQTLRDRGAEFLSPPVDRGPETRAFFRDPDGHLWEISQSG